jgi:hypothetical protein
MKTVTCTKCPKKFIALHEIERNVAPQFIPFARSGVPRR